MTSHAFGIDGVRIVPRNGVVVRYLRSISVLLFVAGLLLMIGSWLLSASPTWTLAGLLLAWAGLVKVVVVRLWRGLAGPGRGESGVGGDG